MRLLSWNCQGLGNPWTGRSFRKIVREQVPNMYFLMETWLDKEGFDNLYSNLPFQNKIIVKYPDSGGGLALLWKNDVAMEVINYTANHVLMKVMEEMDLFGISPAFMYGRRHKIRRGMEAFGSFKIFCGGTLDGDRGF